MFFNDAMAITKEDNFKRKAIHDAILAEQKGMGDISCDDEEFERRMDADKEKGMAEYKNGDPEWKRRMNARVELASHRLMERMRRTDEEWQQIERERPSGNTPMQDRKNASSRRGTETLGQDTATLDRQEAK